MTIVATRFAARSAPSASSNVMNSTPSSRQAGESRIRGTNVLSQASATDIGQSCASWHMFGTMNVNGAAAGSNARSGWMFAQRVAESLIEAKLIAGSCLRA